MRLSELTHRVDDRHRLGRQVHDVLLATLHSWTRNRPGTGVLVELRPGRADYLTRARRSQECEL